MFALREIQHRLIFGIIIAVSLGVVHIAHAQISGVEAEAWYTIDRIPSSDRVEGDFVVGPGKIELEIAPGESKTVMLSVTNRIGTEHVFNFDIEDATGSSDPSKTVDLLGGERGPYTLKDYISIPGDTLTLQHNQRARVPVTITIPPDAEPGGRYGSVLVNTVAVERGDGVTGELTSQSPLIARIGTPLFITIPGEAERQGKLLDFSTIPDRSWFTESPIKFGILYENTGSVHLAPYGTLSITDTFGQEVGYLELDPWFAMPASQRFREVIWDSDYLLGKYTATLRVNRGYQDIIDERSLTFWVVPWHTILITFGVIFVLIFVFRVFFSRFEFRRRL